MAQQVHYTGLPLHPADSLRVGIIVDFMTIPGAKQNGIHIPPQAMWFKLSEVVLWPVIEFVPAKYAAAPTPKKVLIPEMVVDCNNAQAEVEASRRQVPLILAWVGHITVSSDLLTVKRH